MKIVYSLVFLLCAFSVMSSDTSANFLKTLCTHGAFYPVEGLPWPAEKIDHAQKNSDQIKKLIGDNQYGVLIILGPGPGNDIPLSWLVSKFQKIIMIDGYLDPMEKWVQLISNTNRFF